MLNALRRFLSQLPRPVKKLIVMLADGLVLVAAFATMRALRLLYMQNSYQAALSLMLVTVIVTLSALAFFRVYQWQIRHIDFMVLGGITKALLLGWLAFNLASWYLEGLPSPLAGLIFVTLGLTGLLGLRALAQSLLTAAVSGAPVLIYGANEAGRQLAQVWLQGSTQQPVAFIDDHPERQGLVIAGLTVFPASRLPELIQRFQPVEGGLTLCLAEPLVESTRHTLLQQVANAPVRIQNLPQQVDHWLRGQALADQVRDLQIEDLLSRPAIPPDTTLMQQAVLDQIILITGAGGSIGSELVRQLARFQPRQLILADHAEHNLYQIEYEIRRDWPHLSVIPVLIDITQAAAVSDLFEQYTIDAVFHAAAYKHVPLVEANVISGLHNNVMGTAVVAQAAAHCHVKRFVLISTDKAVRPTNIMGASKRLAELVVQAQASLTAQTRFSMVRFGNVLGSSGSVVPLFRQQILAGGPVTVTHPEVTRFFMTIPEAAQLVIQASALAQGGEVFLLDMGEPVKIADMARRMVHLMGRFLAEDAEDGIKIEFTGLRPGEKLYEELLIGGDDIAYPTQHPRIRQANEWCWTPEQLSLQLQTMQQLCQDKDISKIYIWLRDLEIGFHQEK